MSTVIERKIIQADPLLNEEEAAKYLTPVGIPEDQALTTAALKKWRGERVGPDYVKIGRMVGYRQSALDRWIGEQEKAMGA